MSLTNINLPQIPLNNQYGNYVNSHIHSSQSQNGQSVQSSIVQQNQQSQNGNIQQNNVDQQQSQQQQPNQQQQQPQIQQSQNIYIQTPNNQQFPSWSQYPPSSVFFCLSFVVSEKRFILIMKKLIDMI